MADKYGRTPYQIMLENGATEDELRQRLEGRGTAQSYLDREAQKAAAAAAARPTYAIPAQNFDGMARMGASGGWTIDDSESATWQKIAQMANSGDTQGAINLANQLSAAGKFGGYYDDAGNYWGFAQGYTGGANASMQPVVGGKMLTPKGLEYENTGVWLTPDGKALNLGANGTLTNNGETWGTTDNRSAQAMGRWFDENGTDSKDARWNTWDAVGARMGWTPEETFANMSKSGAFLNPELNDNGSGGFTNLIGNPNDPGTFTTLPGNPNDPGNLTLYQQALGALNPYDPNTSTIYQQLMEAVLNGKAPEWTGGDFNWEDSPYWKEYYEKWGNAEAPEYAGNPYQKQIEEALAAYGEDWQGSPYQAMRDEYTQKAANMKWDFNPDTDPVWQALQKQYRREGQRATEDTLGRYAAMTGGMPSTAAVTAASQAGDYYAAQLSDRLPQVYQDAYNRYLQDYMNTLGLANTYAGYDDTEYSRWNDRQGKNWNLATMYDQLGQEDYGRFQDSLTQWNADRNFAYGTAQDAIGNSREDYSTKYKQHLDEAEQYYKDLGILHDTAMEDIGLNTDYNNELYKRILDALEQANYEQEQAENKRRWDLNYGEDKRRWDADFAADEAKTAYQRGRDAVNDQLSMAKLGAQYGDYSGLSGLGIDTSSANPKEVAYAADGSMYKFNTPDAQYFVKNAPNGTPGNPTTMTGGDGSIWRKDEYGGITITTKNGKVFTYSNSVPTQQTPYKKQLEEESPAEEPPVEEEPEIKWNNRTEGNYMYVGGKKYTMEEIEAGINANPPKFKYTYNEKTNTYTVSPANWG